MSTLSKLDSNATTAAKIYTLIETLFPLHRSITGEGVRQTLNHISSIIPLSTIEVPTGTAALDWEVPREWRIRNAFLESQSGERIIDYANSNLHVLNYSVGIDKTLSWSELRPHLYTDPKNPDWIPYRTSYYEERWGLCLSHREFQHLESRGEQQYRVKIDAELIDGSLTYGELKIPGDNRDEVLISCHICHPSLANDNLSGIAVATYLAKLLSGRRNRYTYRFIFVPATIGAITWLSRNKPSLPNISHGLVLTLLGDKGSSTYKRSRAGNAEIDRAVEHVLKHSGTEYTIRPFTPFGYDERQFCSPGFDLPMGCLMRTPDAEYPEYHSSADNMNLINIKSLEDSWSKCAQVLELLESNYRYKNLRPEGEPQLGKHGLYSAFAHDQNREKLHEAVLWVLNLSDGDHTLLQIAEHSDMHFGIVQAAVEALLDVQLIERCKGNQ